MSAQVTNTINGLLHFTEDTNLAVLPIKFAPAPYIASNFPPVLIFSNDFEYARAGLYTNGSVFPGSPNSPGLGQRNWRVVTNSVTVVSNPPLAALGSNYLALANGTLACDLPTAPGHRYQLAYSVRGPCAVGWWNGEVEPLSRRARDLISGNHGAFINGATNTSTTGGNQTNEAYVGRSGLFFTGMISNGLFGSPDLATKIELADPPQLRLTNALTVEGWIRPIAQTNVYINDLLTSGSGPVIEQILFRGDSRNCFDPYYLALKQTNGTQFDLIFHVASSNSPACGVSLQTSDQPIANTNWHHVAAVFESNVLWTNVPAWPTNQLRLYVDGQLLTNVFLQTSTSSLPLLTSYTSESPFQDLEPDFSPGVAIGNRSRSDASEPFRGFMDELTVYARALTEPEIAVIAASGSNGKADPGVPVSYSLAKVRVSLDGAQADVAYGDNSRWSGHEVVFIALRTNMVLELQGLLPGTLVDGVTLSELPPELYYLPEVPLSDLYGENAFGVWTLEIWDNRVGPVTNNAQLLEWQLDFGLSPSNPPPVISLSHGIPYTNALPAYGIQYFNVPVPQWASFATNVLEFAVQKGTTNPLPVTVLFNQTNYPSPADLALIGPSSGTALLTTNGTPPLVIGQPYYLALTNPNPVAMAFSLGVWFDIMTLPNCRVVTNFVGPAGIPRYFQFDVPTNGQPANLPPQAVSFWLTGANSNLTVVLSEHLPLPELNHYDYISQQPCTNDEIVMVLTNSTPFPIQTNRWYVGVFNTTATNVPFSVQACVSTNYPLLIPLTNGVPFVVNFLGSPFVAPPGPPQRFFFDFDITHAAAGVLFELYSLSGDADLVLQRDVPPSMAPYFDTSFAVGPDPEQIVVRTNSAVPDLLGHWYLGVYNNEQSNVTYSIRAVLPDQNGLLVSARPIRTALTPLSPPHGLLLSWNSIEGEYYIVQYTANIKPPATWTNIGFVIASTPLTTFEILPVRSGKAFYRVVQVFSLEPRLTVQFWPGNLVRISWSTAFPGYTLQSKIGLLGAWANAGLPITVVGDEYVAFDTVGPVPKFYRLIK